DDDCAAFFSVAPKISRGINNARGPNRKEDIARFSGRDCTFDRVSRQHFAKPNHVRPQIAAARSTSTVLDVEVAARASVFETTETMNISMQLDNSFAAGASVESVHVLGDEQEFRRAFLHFD